MATLNLAVGFGADDGQWNEGDTTFDRVTNLQVGWVSGGKGSANIYIRFRAVALNQGETINEAIPTFNPAFSDSVNDVKVRIRGALVADVGIPSVYADVEDVDRTTAFVDWTIPAVTVDTPIQGPDIASIIEEIVGQATWASGNDLMLLFEDNGSTQIDDANRRFDSFNTSSGDAPSVAVTYGEAAADPEVSDTTVNWASDAIAEVVFEYTGGDGTETVDSIEISANAGADWSAAQILTTEYDYLSTPKTLTVRIGQLYDAANPTGRSLQVRSTWGANTSTAEAFSTIERYGLPSPPPFTDVLGGFFWAKHTNNPSGNPSNIGDTDFASMAIYSHYVLTGWNPGTSGSDDQDYLKNLRDQFILDGRTVPLILQYILCCEIHRNTSTGAVESQRNSWVNGAAALADFNANVEEDWFLHSASPHASGNRLTGESGAKYYMNPGNAGWQGYVRRWHMLIDEEYQSTAIAEAYERFTGLGLDNIHGRPPASNLNCDEYGDLDTKAGRAAYQAALMDYLDMLRLETGKYVGGNLTEWQVGPDGNLTDLGGGSFVGRLLAAQHLDWGLLEAGFKLPESQIPSDYRNVTGSGYTWETDCEFIETIRDNPGTYTMQHVTALVPIDETSDASTEGQNVDEVREEFGVYSCLMVCNADRDNIFLRSGAAGKYTHSHWNINNRWNAGLGAPTGDRALKSGTTAIYERPFENGTVEFNPSGSDEDGLTARRGRIITVSGDTVPLLLRRRRGRKPLIGAHSFGRG